MRVHIIHESLNAPPYFWAVYRRLALGVEAVLQVHRGSWSSDGLVHRPDELLTVRQDRGLGHLSPVSSVEGEREVRRQLDLRPARDR